MLRSAAETAPAQRIKTRTNPTLLNIVNSPYVCFALVMRDLRDLLLERLLRSAVKAQDLAIGKDGFR